MLTRSVAIVFLAILGGCVTSKEMYFPDGSKGHNVGCESIAGSMEGCFQRAGEICGAKGYKIMNNQAGVLVTRSLFVKCNE